MSTVYGIQRTYEHVRTVVTAHQIKGYRGIIVDLSAAGLSLPRYP